jgi:hypothetical protein
VPNLLGSSCPLDQEEPGAKEPGGAEEAPGHCQAPASQPGLCFALMSSHTPSQHKRMQRAQTQKLVQRAQTHANKGQPLCGTHSEIVAGRLGLLGQMPKVHVGDARPVVQLLPL